MAPRRVLIVSWEYPPDVAGGLGRAVGTLAEALAAGDLADVCVLTRGRRDDVRRGVHVHRVDGPAAPTAVPAFVRWAQRLNHDLLHRGRALAAHQGFDVVHGHDWLVAVAAKRIADTLAVPYVTTAHATEHGRHDGWVDTPPQSDVHRAERWMIGVADRVIVCSQAMRDHVGAVFAPSAARLAVIPNAIGPAGLRGLADLAAVRARFAAPGERLVLLAGRLVHEKGFQDALAALARVPDVRFVLAGAGPYEPELRAQAHRLGLDARGTFTGWIGDDLLAALYRVADLTVVPSRYEPFGLVALEAMAAGCPCLAADTGGLREVVPAGLRVASRDPAALARAIERVLSDAALRDRLVAQATEHVRRFDPAEVARRTGAVYAAAGATASA